MSITSDFEDRIAGAVERLFAGAFRSPVQPVEIARALAKAMDDGRMVGVSRVYAPAAYVVALSAEDADNMGGFTSVLAGELATYLVDRARERSYHVPARPTVAFVVHDDLKLGRFRVSAELASADDDPAAASPVAPGRATSAASPVSDAPPDQDESRLFDWAEPDDEDAKSARPGWATLTVGGAEHDVALRGDRLVIGRVNACDLCLPDANVSRRHAELRLEDDAWVLDDLDSTNGTLVNGRPVTSHALADGDVIEIGATRIVYHGPGR